MVCILAEQEYLVSSFEKFAEVEHTILAHKDRERDVSFLGQISDVILNMRDEAGVIEIHVSDERHILLVVSIVVTVGVDEELLGPH